MLSYKEYYKEIYKDEWYKYSKINEWWKKNTNNGHLNISGDYIETVSFLSSDEKNDWPILENHTNIKNSEWKIFWRVLNQILIDWCIENDKSHIVNCDFTFTKETNGPDIIFNYKYNIDKSNSDYDELLGLLCDCVAEFILSYGKNIPNDWNTLSFGLDNVDLSCMAKQWSPNSDGYLTFGKLTNDNIYNSFVNCM